ncbi:hypothetical protein [Cupriavidus sp. AU9028]|uniref:hypothetical protein n=1 Tax=Cupriavidus sp. AU9028 TaxID=2871157 RepID=UPI001C968B67|nr:hypothetical protein [Cupriavidus sp. AU9028]MBY4897170.1 hypothetical protein [Cupriavidus sp. AU9028]
MTRSAAVQESGGTMAELVEAHPMPLHSLSSARALRDIAADSAALVLLALSLLWPALPFLYCAASAAG